MIPLHGCTNVHAQLNEGGECHEGKDGGEGMIPEILSMDTHAQLDEGGESHEGENGGECHMVREVDIVAITPFILDHAVAGPEHRERTYNQKKQTY